MTGRRSSRRHAAEAAAAAATLGDEPPGWARAALGDLATLQPGYAFKSKSFADKGLRLLRGTNIIPGATRWQEVVHLPEQHFEDFEAYQLKVGDIVIAMDRPVVSSGLKIAQLDQADLPALLLQRVGRFKPAQGVPRRFVYRYLQSPMFLQHIAATATGTQLPHISATDISAAPLMVPPLNEQRRIVAKIDALMARSQRAKEALDAIPPLLERFRQSVLAAAFRGDLTADWRAQNPDVEPADKLLERIRVERRHRWEQDYLAKQRAKGKEPKNDKWKAKYKEPEPVDASGLPDLPRGWSWSTLLELSACVPNAMTDGPFGSKLKTAHYVPSGVRVIRLGNVGVGEFKDRDRSYITQQHATSLSKHQARTGDLLIAALAEPVGRGCLVPAGIGSAVVKADCIRFRPHAAVQAAYVMHWLNSATGRRMSESIAHGIGRLRINMAEMRRLPVPVAPEAEQHEIIRSCEAAIAAGRELGRSVHGDTQELDRLNRAILSKAFRGELVPQDPTDEPASALLERIRAECEAEGK